MENPSTNHPTADIQGLSAEIDALKSRVSALESQLAATPTSERVKAMIAEAFDRQGRELLGRVDAGLI